MTRENEFCSSEHERQDFFGQFIAKIEQANAEKIARREDLPDGRTQIETREGEQFTIERLTDPNDRRVEAAHDLMSRNFRGDVMDDIETIQTAMQGKVVGDEESEDIPLYIHTVEQGDQVVATEQSAILESLDKNLEAAGGRFLIGTALVIDEPLRRQGIGPELFRKRLLDARQIAPNLDSIISETAGQAEAFFNKVGMKRLYLESADGTLQEIPYLQSVLADSWDKKTGEPMPGNEREPLHLMVGFFDRASSEMTAEDVLERIRGIMHYNSYQTEGYFRGNQTAYRRHQEILDADLAELEAILARAKDGKIRLLSADEREQYSGRIIEYKSLDE